MTVVLKLLNLVRPHRAYFGEKDYQQMQTIIRMVEDFFIPTEIVPCATVRAPSGLAESSRNRLLSAAGVEKAACLCRALTTAASPAEANATIEAEGLRVEYVEEHWGRRFVAAGPLLPAEVAETLHVNVEHRRDEERQHLRDHQAANHRQAQRAARFSAGA